MYIRLYIYDITYGFVWSACCGCLECSYWGISFGQSSQLFFVGVFMMSVVSLPWMWGMLCAAMMANRQTTKLIPQQEHSRQPQQADQTEP
jgi:hypothetical protein